MKYDKNLLKIIEDKNFKTFWHCLDYLLIAGYSPIDAFGMSLKQFGESNIFSSVAFVRMEEWGQHIYFQDFDPNRQIKTPPLVIGLIDDSNIHLDGLYTVYRRMLNKLVLVESDIEDTCEIIKTSQLTPFILRYLLDVTKKHYGVESFVISKEPNPTIRTPDFRELIGRFQPREEPINPNDLQNRWPPAAQPDAEIIRFADMMQRKRNREQL